MEVDERLYVVNRVDWRAWLEKNYAAKKEVWLIFYKRHTGKPSISYDDAVEEALCFGWIDSIIKRIDGEMFTRRFSPRKAKSKWSELNKKRARKMIKEALMTKAGFAAIREAEKSGEWFKTSFPNKQFVVPAFVKEAFAANEKASANFNKLAKSYRKQFIGWIVSAKREATRQKRLAEAVALLEKGERLGMK